MITAFILAYYLYIIRVWLKQVLNSINYPADTEQKKSKTTDIFNLCLLFLYVLYKSRCRFASVMLLR